jgi:hypothetical protein
VAAGCVCKAEGGPMSTCSRGFANMPGTRDLGGAGDGGHLAPLLGLNRFSRQDEDDVGVQHRAGKTRGGSEGR